MVNGLEAGSGESSQDIVSGQRPSSDFLRASPCSLYFNNKYDKENLRNGIILAQSRSTSV